MPGLALLCQFDACKDAHLFFLFLLVEVTDFRFLFDPTSCFLPQAIGSPLSSSADFGFAIGLEMGRMMCPFLVTIWAGSGEKLGFELYSLEGGSK